MTMTKIYSLPQQPHSHWFPPHQASPFKLITANYEKLFFIQPEKVKYVPEQLAIKDQTLLIEGSKANSYKCFSALLHRLEQ